MKLSSFSSFALSQDEEVKSVGGYMPPFCCDIYLSAGGFQQMECAGSSHEECEWLYGQLNTVEAVECNIDAGAC